MHNEFIRTLILIRQYKTRAKFQRNTSFQQQTHNTLKKKKKKIKEKDNGNDCTLIVLSLRLAARKTLQSLRLVERKTLQSL